MPRHNATKTAKAKKTNATNTTLPANANAAYEAMLAHLEFDKVEAILLLAKLSVAEIELIPVIGPMLRDDMFSIMVVKSHDGNDALTGFKLLQLTMEWFPTHQGYDFPEALRIDGKAPAIPAGLVDKLINTRKFLALCVDTIADYTRIHQHDNAIEIQRPLKLRHSSEINISELSNHHRDVNLLGQAGMFMVNNPALVCGGTLLLSVVLLLSLQLARPAGFVASSVNGGINILRNSRLNFFKQEKPETEPTELNGVMVQLPPLRGFTKSAQ
jgi:hypothetical protein